MIFSGMLRENLSFYRIEETQTETGFKHTVERFLFTCKAERTKNRENYVVDAGELFHSNELTFRIRWRSGIQETDIVVYNDERYRITSLNQWKRDNEITLILARIND